MNKSESIVELTKSLIAFQGELKPVPKESTNPFFKSKYADLSAIWEFSRPLLVKHGFAVSQLPQAKENQIILTTLLMHSSGEWLSSDLIVTPNKQNDPQAVGSALTYARRYALSAILGICSEEDDDAEVAVGRTRKTAASVSAIKSAPVVPATPGTTKPAQQTPGATPEQFANAGEFLTTCSKMLGLNKSMVLEILKVDSLDKVNFTDAYLVLKEYKK